MGRGCWHANVVNIFHYIEDLYLESKNIKIEFWKEQFERATKLCFDTLSTEEQNEYLKDKEINDRIDEQSIKHIQNTKNILPKEPHPEQANNGCPEPQQVELKDLLPEKLKADEAVKVFQKAIDAQLITYSPEGLKWNNTKQLLAYFATKVSEKFSLTIKLDKDGNKTTAWKPFETLFKEQNLKGAKQNWMRLNTKFEPTLFEKVDALF